MKKIIYLSLLIILSSCFNFNNKEAEENNNLIINTGNIIESTIDINKIDQIKNLLKDENTKNHDIYSQTGTQNNIQENTSNIKVENKSKIIYPINPPKSAKIPESSILTEEELNIIENTTDGEIDELIDILFKDLN